MRDRLGVAAPAGLSDERAAAKLRRFSEDDRDVGEIDISRESRVRESWVLTSRLTEQNDGTG